MPKTSSTEEDGVPVIYHLFPPSPYTTRFIRFIAEHGHELANAKNHVIVKFEKKPTFPVESSGGLVPVTIVRGTMEAYRLLLRARDQDVICIHSLCQPRLMALFLLLRRKYISRCVWAIWGGDLYYFRDRDPGLKGHLIELVRRLFIRQLRYVAAWVPGDFDVLKRVYRTNTKVQTFGILYPLPTDLELVAKVQNNLPAHKRTCKEPRRIVVGNSATETNKHLEIFSILAAKSGTDFLVYCPLSYGESAYAKTVIERGRQLFGSRFFPMTEILPIEKYVQFLASCDVLVMNHQRMQGGGNIVTMLALGKKVFVRGDATTFNFLCGMGLAVHNTRDLERLAMEDIVRIEEEESVRNRQIVAEVYTENNIVMTWNRLFRAVLGDGSA